MRRWTIWLLRVDEAYFWASNESAPGSLDGRGRVADGDVGRLAGGGGLSVEAARDE